ncbi:MAG: hypothetical protein LBG06_06150 [Deltaproteobacteria bacterium]|nr:hypothetical protein [Deltaproteobacteria bacterium]
MTNPNSVLRMQGMDVPAAGFFLDVFENMSRTAAGILTANGRPTDAVQIMDFFLSLWSRTMLTKTGVCTGATRKI